MDDILPQFLVQQEPRLSIKEAEIIVNDLLKIFSIKVNSVAKNKEYIIKNSGTEKEEKKKYYELVDQVRKSGICYFLQIDLDSQDPVFGSSVGLSVPNWQMKIKTEWAGYEKELIGPCRSIANEIDLSEDIEFYKEETCFESASHDFTMVSRNYRGYLFSSIALVDSYINRHLIYFEFIGKKGKEFDKLKNSRNVEERIELFVSIFCNFNFSELKQSQIWDDFKRLKDQRNEIIHSLKPFMGFEIKELATNLNLSIKGVGGLLKKLQIGQDRNSLTFIERVRSSPAIHFNQITLRSDGKHHEKRHFNKVTR